MIIQKAIMPSRWSRRPFYKVNNNRNTSAPVLRIGFGSSDAATAVDSSPLEASDLCSGDCLRIGFGFTPSLECLRSFFKIDRKGLSSITSAVCGLMKCVYMSAGETSFCSLPSSDDFSPVKSYKMIIKPFFIICASNYQMA